MSLAACGAVPDGEDAWADETIADTQEALFSGWGNQAYAITRTSDSWGSIGLEPIEDSVCVLSKISGKFNAGNETIFAWDEARVYKQGTFWRLGASANSGFVNAEARCFRHDRFFAAGDTVLRSGEFWREQRGSSSSCTVGFTDAWLGDATTYISGVSGEFRGGGESVQINQSSTGNGLSHLRVSSCQRSTTGFAHSYFIGEPHSGHVARFVGPNGEGSAAEAGEFSAHGKDGRIHRIDMVPAGLAFCHFTHISGKFDGGGEYARIYLAQNAQGSEIWRLDVRAGSAEGVRARVRCFHRFQF